MIYVNKRVKMPTQPKKPKENKVADKDKGKEKK